MAVVRGIEEITPAWCTYAFSGSVRGADVRAVTVAEVTYGSACRARLRIEGSPPDRLPVSAVVKGSFTTGLGPDAVAGQWRQLMTTLNVAEQLFYTGYSEPMGDRVPRYFYADADADGTTVLLLEDLALREVTFGRFDQPRTVTEQAQVLDTLARLHASHWDEPGLLTAPLPDGMIEGGMVGALLSPINWKQQSARPRWERVPRELDDRTKVSGAIRRLWQLKRAGGRCVIHGDPHIANTFFDAAGAGLLDFQLFTSGHWASDVVYATASALTIADRRRYVRGLLEGYLGALRRYGVAPPSWDEAWLAYRQFALWGFLVFLTPGDGVQSEAYNTVVGERHATAALDLDALTAITERA